MKESDRQLERLFRAARQAPDEVIEPVPPYLKTSLLAHWRARLAEADATRALVLVLRRALVFAGVLMLGSIAWAYQGLRQPPPNDVALANYDVRVTVLP